MPMSPLTERFVLHWGEMGTRWGVNRSVAQVHALLYLSPAALTAEEIADALTLARSNVSTSIRELQGYGLIEVTHVMGDRRDFFRAHSDPWEILMRVAEERKKREIDPTLTMLRACAVDAEDDKTTPEETKARILGMLIFLEELTTWYDQVKQLPRPVLHKIVKLGARIARFMNK